MNKYVRAVASGMIAAVKFGWLKLSRGNAFRGSVFSFISPCTEITLDRGGKLTVGRMFKMRGGAKLRVRKGGMVVLGSNFSMSNRCLITAYESVIIGDDVQLGPDVKIYDQDHDFRAPGGLKAMKFKTSPVKIGSNVWIGANCVVLRGTEIGDNCVIGAGSVIKGKYPANSVIVQKRSTEVISIK